MGPDGRAVLGVRTLVVGHRRIEAVLEGVPADLPLRSMAERIAPRILEQFAGLLGWRLVRWVRLSCGRSVLPLRRPWRSSMSAGSCIGM